MQYTVLYVYSTGRTEPRSSWLSRSACLTVVYIPQINIGLAKTACDHRVKRPTNQTLLAAVHDHDETSICRLPGEQNAVLSLVSLVYILFNVNLLSDHSE